MNSNNDEPVAARSGPCDISPPDAETMPPMDADRYGPCWDGQTSDVAEFLGQGSQARVFAAWDRQLHREVALKELPASASAVEERRFLREARILAKLNHPSIPPIYAVGRRMDGSLFYTMKRIVGVPFDQALAKTTCWSQRLVLLNHFCAAVQAVAFAHRHGVVHRDLKPQHIIAGEFGTTYVLDWGLAKTMEECTLDATGGTFSGGLGTDEGRPLGSEGYMAPEQTAGSNQSVAKKSDVWALGQVLLRILEPEARPWWTPRDSAYQFLMALAKTALRRNEGQQFEDAEEMFAAIELAIPTFTLIGRWPAMRLFARSDALARGQLNVWDVWIDPRAELIVAAITAISTLIFMVPLAAAAWGPVPTPRAIPPMFPVLYIFYGTVMVLLTLIAVLRRVRRWHANRTWHNQNDG